MFFEALPPPCRGAVRFFRRGAVFGVRCFGDMGKDFSLLDNFRNRSKSHAKKIALWHLDVIAANRAGKAAWWGERPV